jgi:hypothetical protein
MLSLLLSRLAEWLAAALQAAGHAISAFYAVVREAHETAARFEQLAQMSDAELARHGLKREGLAQAVFTRTAEA